MIMSNIHLTDPVSYSEVKNTANQYQHLSMSLAQS